MKQEHRISAHDQLYQDAHRRAARASEYECWYPEEVTFRPAVNPPRRPSKAAVPRDGEDEPVQERCALQMTASNFSLQIRYAVHVLGLMYEMRIIQGTLSMFASHSSCKDDLVYSFCDVLQQAVHRRWKIWGLSCDRFTLLLCLSR